MLALSGWNSVAHAASGGAACDDLSGQPLNLNRLDYFQDILPVLERAGCSGCHGINGQSPNISSQIQFPLLELLGTFSSQTNLLFVEPFFPKRSYLFQKINCAEPVAGTRMPRGGFAMTIEDQGLIYDWIQQGALQERLANVVFRDVIFRDGVESLR